MLEDNYQQDDIYIGTPAIIGSQGIEQVIELELTEREQGFMDNSAYAMRKIIEDSFAKLEDK